MLPNYLKIAWRNLMRNKSYAAINILGLSLGIACSLLIFTLISHHLSIDQFHSKKDRIFRIVTAFHEDNIEYTPGVPQPLGKIFGNEYPYAEQMANVKSNTTSLITIRQDDQIKKFKEERDVAFATPSFFKIFDFPLVQGNADSMLSSPNSVVITQKIARKFFETENAIGRVLLLNNRYNYQVTGILKDLPQNTDRKEEIYLSYQNLKDENEALAREDSWSRVSSSMQSFILIKPGVVITDVNKALSQFAKKHLTAEDAKITIFSLQPLRDIHFNTTYDGQANKKYLWAFGFVGLFLILTACVNFINLATAQSLVRGKEIGVRKVMGGLPRQLFWQFMIETALITLFSIVLACGLAESLLPSLNLLFKAKMALHIFSALPVPLFLLSTGIFIIFFSGSYPSLILSRFKPIIALKGKLSQQHIGGFPLRRILVIVQFALAQILIIGMLVISGQMRFSQVTDLGFTKNGIIVLPVPVKDMHKMKDLQTRLSKLAGVDGVTLCEQPPASEYNHLTDTRFASRPKDESWEINLKLGDDRYLKTFGLRMIAGRNLFPSDTSREFLVNETAVRKLGLKSPQEIIGQSLEAGGISGIVVGVLKDFNNASFRQEISPICMTTNVDRYNNCAIKFNMIDVKGSIQSFERIWTQVYGDQVFDYQFLDDRIAKFYAADNTMLTLIECCSGIAIFIGCLGLYGLISFMAVRKTKEIAVRKVLGATMQHIVWIFSKEFCILLLLAFFIAGPLAWWIMNGYLRDFRYRIQIGPDIFVMAIALTLIIAFLSVIYRSLKSAMTNPIKGLSSE